VELRRVGAEGCIWRWLSDKLSNIDVPTETYYGTTPGTDTCQFVWGHDQPFAGHHLRALYPTHGAYVSKVTQDLGKLVHEGYLTETDGRKIIAQAARSRVR
jgi:hypothetical protein